MNVYCLYFPDGKRYVGVESHDGQRIRSHRAASRRLPTKPTLVAKALNRHGWDRIQWRYLAKNCSDREGHALERFFIRQMRLQDEQLGYNVSPGINGPSQNPEGMVELRFNIHDARLQPMIKRTGIDCATDLARDGLRLLEWATAHVNAGHEITCRVSDERYAELPMLDSIIGANGNRSEEGRD